MSILIAPSILSSDFARLGEQVREAEEAGADMIHVDVMDGHFVPNITIGPAIVEACRRSTRLPLDVHLMISEPERFIEQFAAAGAHRLTVHAEATAHLHRTLQLIREAGAECGLALNPLTPLTVLRDALPDLSLVLVMTVNPGFGGQRFIAGSLERLRTVRAWRDELDLECLIEVDGGINVDTAPAVVAAGAQVLVAGSAVFNASANVADNVSSLRRAVSRS